MSQTASKAYAALVQVMRSINAVGKNRKNEQQNFAYRGVDDVFNELHAACAEAGVVPINELVEHTVQEKPTARGGVSLHHFVRVKISWIADDGSQTTPVLYPGEAADTGDKGIGKAMQYALKQYLIQTFMIPTSDGNNDPDAQSVEWAQRQAEQAQRRASRQPKAAPAEPLSKPAKAEPTGDQVFGVNKQAIEACKTVDELRALVCKGSKYLSAEQMAELRKLRGNRMQTLAIEAGKSADEERRRTDPMASRLAESYARLGKIDKDRANAILRETTDTARRVELMERALVEATPTQPPQEVPAALQPGYGEMQ